MSQLNRRLALAGTVVALIGVAAPATALAKHGADDPVGHVRHGRGADDVSAQVGPRSVTGVHIRRSRGLDDGPGHVRRGRGSDDRIGTAAGTSRDDSTDDRRGRGRGRGGDDR